MATNTKIVTIFGGTGFIGRYIVRELAKLGYIVKVASRVPERAYFLRTAGTVGQIVPMACNYKDPASIDAAIRGSQMVINCIGILYERRRGDFRRVHVDAADAIAKASARSGVLRLVHISALGIASSKSRYAKSKYEGELAVLKAFPNATILRPSVVFGPEDEFFNMFAGLARVLPALPLIGGGKTKFQPVYAGDVAAAVAAAVTLPVVEEQNPQGRIYELGGPEIVTLKDIYKRLMEWTGRSRMMVTLPFGVARVQAQCLRWVPPKPILTPDQVISLQTDSIVSPGAATLEDLGVRATGMGLIVPVYLERFRPGGRFAERKSA